MSLPILTKTVELPEQLKKKRDIKVQLAERLKEEGFQFSIENEQIIYRDFFNEATISTREKDDTVILTYNLAVTAESTVAIVLSLLLALLAGIILLVVWYLKYSKLKQSIQLVTDKLSQTKEKVYEKAR